MIGDILDYDGGATFWSNDMPPPQGQTWGHTFRVSINIHYGPPTGAPDCRLMWFERTTRAYGPLPAGQWRNLFGEIGPWQDGSYDALNPVWEHWSRNAHDVSVPGGGKFYLEDRPNMRLNRDPHGDKKRILEFCVVAKCSHSPTAHCVGYKWASAVQGLLIDSNQAANDQRLLRRALAEITYNGGANPLGGVNASPDLAPYR